MENTKVILRHIVTEKTSYLTDNFRQYSFYVEKNANKTQIKKAVEKLYAVEVLGISTMKLGGGKKRKKYTNKGVLNQVVPIRKKAIVTLKENQSIDFSKNTN